MEKKLSASIQTSAEEFLSCATQSGFKSVRPPLKSLIWAIKAPSNFSSSLPLALRLCISRSIVSFEQFLQPKSGEVVHTPVSPPTKRLRRSARQAKNKDEPGTEKPEEQVVLLNIRIYAHIALLCITHPGKIFDPLDLLPAVSELHDNLIIFESDLAILSEIANLCEEWWKENLPGRETLISQFLPFLLSRSLTLCKKVDVHRVCVLREAFSLFDFEDESIEDLKLLLMRCVIAPLYLKTEDGRRFLTFMFGLSDQLVKEVLAMIKSQIPFGKKSILEAYADILFRAWKVAEGSRRFEIENGFLQGLIESAIHANSVSFAASIRRVLGGFINQRTTDGVEKLLFRLAEPVIFRSLQVANSNVRQNALHLLLDMFPLEDPDSKKEDKDTLLDKQFFLLGRLLMDDCPDVRVVAVEGSCRILNLFWEIIPSSTITTTLRKIFDDMAHDVCHEIRLSTLNGIMYLLGNPQSHEILKVLLPNIGHLINDSVLSVRVAVVDLLIILRDIRTFEFHKVVSIDILLSVLENDQTLAAKKITKLLIPSYFPSKVTPKEACNRCVTLVKRSPMAGARFCEFALSEGASHKYLMELIKVFLSLALSYDDLDDDQLEGLFVSVASLCNSLGNEKIYENALIELFSGQKLKQLLAAANTERDRSSIYKIGSIISKTDISVLFENCMDLVTDPIGLLENSEKQDEVRSAHKLMLACDRFDDVLEALTRLLQELAYGCHEKFDTEIPQQVVSSAKRRKNKFSVKSSSKLRKKSSNKDSDMFKENYIAATGIAWQMKELLITEDSRKKVLEFNNLEMAFLALKVISEVSIVECVHYEYMDTFPVLAYTSLALHMAIHNISGTGTKNCTMNQNNGLEDSYVEGTVLDQTMDHLLNCVQKLFGQLDQGSISSDQKIIAKSVKMQTAILKFIADAATISSISHVQERCLKFALVYIQHCISALKNHSREHCFVFKEAFKETYLCLKSSCTYTAKLVNLVLRNSSDEAPPPLEVYDLANNLLDLMNSMESCVGSTYASGLVTAVKPWLPDLILALGSGRLGKHTEERDSFISFDWPLVLAKLELIELSREIPDEETDEASEADVFSAFKTLTGMLILLLRGNPSVLEAVGLIFLNGTLAALRKKDFRLVLGLLHFVCLKLVRDEKEEWGEVTMMLGAVHEIYHQIEKEIEGIGSREDGKELERARALLEPIWMHYGNRNERNFTMEE